MAGEVGGGGEPVEIVDVEQLVDVDAGQQPPGVTPPAGVAGRPCVLNQARTTSPSLVPNRQRQEKKASAASGGAPRNIHISAMRSSVEPVHERVARFERVVVAPATHRGVLPLRGPAVGADAELLVERGSGRRSSRSTIRGHRGDHQHPANRRPSDRADRRWNTRSSVKMLGAGYRGPGRRSPRSCGSRPGRWSARSSVLSEAVVADLATVRRASRAGTSGEPSILERARLHSSTDVGLGGSRCFSDAPMPSLRTVARSDNQTGEHRYATTTVHRLRRRSAQELSERLADVFRTATASDVLTDDVFLDGHPPLWRFQLQGRDASTAGSRASCPRRRHDGRPHDPHRDRLRDRVRRRHQENGAEITDRKILLAEVRAGRIAELTIYCSGDWNAELRARHDTETQLIRP